MIIRISFLVLMAMCLTARVSASPTAAATEEWVKLVNDTLARNHQWVRAAEDIMAHVVLGPLQDQLKGAAFSQRNRTQIIHVQTNHLRAHVMQRLLQALEEEVLICPWPTHIGMDAILNLVRELKQHEFQAEWVPNLHRCPGQAGYIRVHVPLPAFE
jgi:hypothetical protein